MLRVVSSVDAVCSIVGRPQSTVSDEYGYRSRSFALFPFLALVCWALASHGLPGRLHLIWWPGWAGEDHLSTKSRLWHYVDISPHRLFDNDERGIYKVKNRFVETHGSAACRVGSFHDEARCRTRAVPI